MCERVLQVVKPLLPDCLGPLRFKFQHSGTLQVDRLPAAASHKYKTSLTSFLSSTFDVAESFQLTEKIVRRLLSHVEALGQIAGTHAVWMGIYHHLEECRCEI